VTNDEKAAEDNDDPPPPAKLPSSKKTKKATTGPPKKDDEKKPPAVVEKSKVPKKTAAAVVDPPSAPTPERIADLEPPQPARPPATNQAAQRPSSSPTLFGNQFKEAIFQDKAGGANSDLGFFDGAQENFPGLEAFGLSWEPKKVATPSSASSRSKRAATIVLKNPFYYRDDRRKRVSRQGQRPLRQKPAAGAAALGSRRSGQGPSGFWDNTEFDSDFFNGGSPGPATNSQTGFSSSYEDFSSPAPLPPVQKYVQQQPQYQKPARLTYSLPSQVRKLANIRK
jgi:hypothetical protein